MANDPINTEAYAKAAQQKVDADDAMVSSSKRLSAAIEEQGADFERLTSGRLKQLKELGDYRREIEADVGKVNSAIGGLGSALRAAAVYAPVDPATKETLASAGGIASGIAAASSLLKPATVAFISGQDANAVTQQKQLEEQLLDTQAGFLRVMRGGSSEIDGFLKEQEAKLAQSDKQVEAAKDKVEAARKEISSLSNLEGFSGNEGFELKELANVQEINDARRKQIDLLRLLIEERRNAASGPAEQTAAEVQQKAAAIDSVTESVRARTQATEKANEVDKAAVEASKSAGASQVKRAQAETEAEQALKKTSDAANQRQKAALDEISKTGEKIFDSFGNAFTELAINGGDAAEVLRKTFTAALKDIEREAIKLAVINPVKNAIFGGNAPTIYDLPIFGGGGTGTAGGTSANRGGGSVGSPNFGSGWSSTGGVNGSIFGPETRQAIDQFGYDHFDIGTLEGDGGNGIVGGLGSNGSLGRIAGYAGGAATVISAFMGPSAGGNNVRQGTAALAGAVIGSVIPGIGTVVGAMIGQMIGSLFDKKPTVGPGGQLTGTYGPTGYSLLAAGQDNGYDAGVNRPTADAIGKAISDAVGKAGGTLVSTGQYTIGYDAGTKKYIGAGAYDASVHGTFDKQEDAVAAATFYGLKGASVEGLGTGFNAALKSDSSKDLNSLLANIATGSLYDQLIKTGNAADMFGVSLENLSDSQKAVKQAQTAATATAKSYTDTIEKQQAAFLALGLDTGTSLNAMRATVQKDLDALQTPSATLSAVTVQVETLKAQWNAMKPVLEKVGVSAEDATKRINDGLAASLQHVASVMNASNADRLQQAADPNAFQISQLRKGYQGEISDATLVGAGKSDIAAYYTRAVQAVIDGIHATGSEFTRLAALFPELSGGLHSWADSVEGLQQRMQEAQQKADAAKENYVQAINAELSAYAQARDQARQFASSLTKIFDGNLLGQFSPLDPESRFREAQQQFRDAYATVKANPTDANAQQNFEQAQQAYLQANADYWGSANPVAFQEVQSALQDVASIATAQADAAQVQVTLLQNQLTALGVIATGIQTLNGLTAARINAGNAYNTAVTNQTSVDPNIPAVSNLYHELLGRDPDSGGLAVQLNALNNGLTIDQLRNNILNSAEYLSTHPGFATGGSFTVGGWGGVDSTLVRFRATPGEQVTVTNSANDNGAVALLDEIRGLRNDLGASLRRLSTVTGLASDRNEGALSSTTDAVRAVRREIRTAGVRR